MARILVAASPLSGHLLPLRQIGAHLQAVGHKVSVLTDEAGPVTAPRPPSLANRLLPKLFRRYLLGRSDVRSTFIAPLVGQYRALEKVLAAEPVDVVLADLAFTGALPLVTSSRPRPAVLVFGVGPLTLSSSDTPPFGMAWTPRPRKDYRGMHAVVHRVLFADIHNELNESMRAVGAPDIPSWLVNWPQLADRLLQLTVPGFEYPRTDLPANVEFVGPVLPEPGEDFEPPSWWGEVLGVRTVVHVTQGTYDNRDLDQLVGPTLRAFADQKDIAVVATTGRRTGQRLSARIPSNALVTEWIPYSALLPHVDVMITNGGYGGVQQALAHGIPVVVAGESSDKAEVAARVAYTGVGVNLGTATPSPAQIAAAVREATGRCRPAAVRLGREIARTTTLETIAGIVADEIERSAAAPNG